MTIKKILPAAMLLTASAATAQQSFINTYKYKVTDYDAREVSITGIVDGVVLKGDISIPGSFTDPDSGIKYTVAGLDDDMPELGMREPVFAGQTEITSIHIPSTITSIAPGAFTGCKKLKEFTVSSLSKTYKTIDGSLYHLRSADDIDLLRFPPARTSTGFTLPAEADYILEEAFADNYTVTTLRLSGWQEVWTDALRGNLGITKFELNDHHRYETDGNFLYEDGRSTIAAVAPRYKMGGELTLPAGVTCIRSVAGSRASSISIPASVVNIWGNAFAGCHFITATIPATVTRITTQSLFEGCASLTSVVIDAQIAKVGECMFAGCAALETVKLPPCTTLGRSCFLGCASLTSFSDLYKFPFVSEAGGQFARSGLTSADIPAAWSEIPAYMFMDCATLTSVTFPDHTESIERKAFCGTALESLNTRNINTIHDYAISTPGTLRKVVIPAHEGTMDLWSNAITLGSDASLYIDHKEMGDYRWPQCIVLPEDASTDIYTSKRSFSYFFHHWNRLYVPAGSRPHYRKMAYDDTDAANVYEMFSCSDANPALAAVTVTPAFGWVKIAGVTINGKAATADGERWTARGAASGATMNVVISYTANDVPMSTEYNLSASSSVAYVAAKSATPSPRLIIYHEATATPGATYLDLTGRPCHPAENAACIEINR